jgi:hypothetical protein
MCLNFLSTNPNIFTYDYKKIKERKQYIHEDLMKKLFHPSRVEKFLNDNPERELEHMYDLDE